MAMPPDGSPNQSNQLPLPGQDAGTASGGTTTTLTDNTKGWAKNQWFQALVYVSVNGTTYHATVSGNTSNTLTFVSAIPTNIQPGSPYRLQSVTTQVATGQTSPGIKLNVNQQIVEFAYAPQDIEPTPYPIAWVQPLLASGGSSQLYDVDTGIIMPYTVPAGYTLSIIEERMGFNQDSEGWIFFDGLLVALGNLQASGFGVDFQNLVKFSTTLLDPTAQNSHTVSYTIYNRGLSSMKGGINVVAILESVNTPPFPTVKDTRCPFCQTVNNVSVHTTTIVCSNCGRTYFVSDSTRKGH